jgi:hypothetical protein
VPIEAGDHEHVASVERIEHAALIGAVGLGSTRHFTTDLTHLRFAVVGKRLFDKLVGGGQQRFRDGKAEHLGGFYVDDMTSLNLVGCWTGKTTLPRRRAPR